MITFAYLKQIIQDRGYTLQKVAEQTNMTKGYLSQLLNNKIKNPSATKLEALYQFLNLTPKPNKKTIGVIFGAFYPLHTGHIYLIQRAISQVEELHIILRHHTERDYLAFKDSAMSKQPTIYDRLRWLLQTFKYQKNVYIHSLNEDGLDINEPDPVLWSERVKELFAIHNFYPDYVYTNLIKDISLYKEHLNIDTRIIDPDRTFMNISGLNIRRAPLKYWDYIPTEVRPFFVKRIAILGGESSGKTIMVNKLANLFNTTSAWEFGREYVFKQLGGDERALQFSDYDKISLGQAQYIDFAVKHANKIAFIDTDFLTTQAFCVKYEGKPHPFVQALIESYPFDMVILLENNTPWVSDGVRRLGSSKLRKEFQTLLIELLNKNNIPFIHIDSDDYDERFLACIELINNLLRTSK